MIMTQCDFIKKFLPEYDKKLKEEIPDFDSRRGNEHFGYLWTFVINILERPWKTSLKEFVISKERYAPMMLNVNLIMTCLVAGQHLSIV